MNHTRDTNGHFTPGTSGNPAGRPPGITDRRVAAKKQLLEPLLPEAIAKLAKAVSEGERWAVELVVTYSVPHTTPVAPEEIAAFAARLEPLAQIAKHQ